MSRGMPRVLSVSGENPPLRRDIFISPKMMIAGHMRRSAINTAAHMVNPRSVNIHTAMAVISGGQSQMSFPNFSLALLIHPPFKAQKAQREYHSARKENNKELRPEYLNSHPFEEYPQSYFHVIADRA